jgi:hypothetical protein
VSKNDNSDKQKPAKAPSNPPVGKVAQKGKPLSGQKSKGGDKR